jgi:hypothetical protein
MICLVFCVVLHFYYFVHYIFSAVSDGGVPRAKAGSGHSISYSVGRTRNLLETHQALGDELNVGCGVVRLPFYREVVFVV